MSHRHAKRPLYDRHVSQELAGWELRISALTRGPHASTYNDDVETNCSGGTLSDGRQERLRVRACMHTRFACATCLLTAVLAARN
jgi:hypothetical protein